jgi:hypothetical protein
MIKSGMNCKHQMPNSLQIWSNNANYSSRFEKKCQVGSKSVDPQTIQPHIGV